MSAYTPFHSKFFAHRIMLEGRSDEAFAKSLSTARVDMKPHQVEAARFALHSPLSKGVILADEVGLGKTIEACLVIAQKWAERRRNVLLIAPASLRTQWQQELQEKFSLPSVILDSKTYRDAVKNGQRAPFDNDSAIIITSYQYAAANSDQIHRIGWDLVIIDEAHRLRNVYKKNTSAQAKRLKEALSSRFKVLLTATPMQNSLMELFGLVSMIDDNFFGDEQSFRVMYGRGTDKQSLISLRRRMAPLYKRHLRRDVQAAGHVNYTRRLAVTFDFEPHSLEEQLYEGVSSYLQKTDSIAFGSKPNQLVLIGARKTLGSSIAAIAMFLENVISRLKRNQVVTEAVVEDIDDTAEIQEEIADAATLADSADGSTEDVSEEDRPEIDSKKLAAEISELEGYLALARSIGSNSKGEKLISRLPEVLDEVVAREGKRKAVIFTESVRTQNYLYEILSQNGYSGQIALMNGSNSDPESQKIYKDWLKEKQGTDAVSGSKSADMKSAIVSAFKSDAKSILIATESGAEGINLQFCSLLINFDLPWNPQRVEQRIGRCHRYGQKIDVTVVNMLNRKNQAERRIYELLSNKFRLFEGLFGASDQVLGVIESGIDFEKKVLAVVQSCRTEAQVNEAFQKLEAELEDQIKADMAETRQQLFDLFDASIVDMLRQRGGEIERTMSEFERRLWLLARSELPEATFSNEGIPSFKHAGKTWSTVWPEADHRGWQFFRLGDGTLADGLVRESLSRPLSDAKLHFDYQSYREEGQPKLSDIEAHVGKRGWMRVSLLRAETAMGSRDSLVLAAITDDGTVLASETAERFFQLPAVVDVVDAEYPTSAMASIDDAALKAAQQAAEDENVKWLDEETIKLEAYAEDLERANDLRVKELDVEARAARKALRGNQSVALADKLIEERRIKRLEEERDELKLSTFKTLKEIRKEVNDKLDEVAAKLAITPNVTPVMTIRWEIVA
ncbi:DEAD/DEAH box helicase [Rhizobium sp. CFBP 13726]|uniref:SNF2-related protein n=1 Tax=Rhizobium sp. CFBP 13726 TaxID=2775296 RepID=UPI00177CEEB3|nr:SNF2-related protein [Rhizobium sp. CFBP 13726]MBD8653657.1 DEAD/DEAH box helicase [Rhizobium sp. CFBP 13726]